MSELKIIWHNDGHHNKDSVRVTVRRQGCDELVAAGTPDFIVGIGSDFGSARADFDKKLSEYIAELTKFRNEIVNSSRAYTEAVEVKLWHSVPY